MTPLAHRIVKEFTLPVKRRSFIDRCGLLEVMGDIHCFEVSDVFDAACSLVKGKTENIHDLNERGHEIATRVSSLSERTSFLPAPNTWIEWTSEIGGRTAVLLREDEKNEWCSIRIAECSDRGVFASAAGIFCMGLRNIHDASVFRSSVNLSQDQRVSLCGLMLTLHGLLAFINTPRVIGRATHAPHAGLQKALTKARAAAFGKYALHAWTEIRLHVRPEHDANRSDEDVWLTGRRALHFVRCHLRLRLGQLELVTAHWRGDPALGIKQSRYKVVA